MKLGRHCLQRNGIRFGYQPKMREAHTKSFSMPPKKDDLIHRVGFLASGRVKSLYLSPEMCPVISMVVDKAKARGYLCNTTWVRP